MTESAYNVILETLELDAHSAACDKPLRKEIRAALDDIQEHPGSILDELKALRDCATQLAAVLPYAENEVYSLEKHSDSPACVREAKVAGVRVRIVPGPLPNLKSCMVNQNALATAMPASPATATNPMKHFLKYAALYRKQRDLNDKIAKLRAQKQNLSFRGMSSSFGHDANRSDLVLNIPLAEYLAAFGETEAPKPVTYKTDKPIDELNINAGRISGTEHLFRVFNPPRRHPAQLETSIPCLGPRPDSRGLHPGSNPGHGRTRRGVIMMDFDDDAPAGFRDADFETRSLEESANRIARLRKKGICVHGSLQGPPGPPSRPTKVWTCTQCGQQWPTEREAHDAYSRALHGD